MFAIVTTGAIWEFGKLEQRLFTYHPLPLSVQDIGRLLGVLDFLFQRTEIAASRFNQTNEEYMRITQMPIEPKIK